MTRRGSAAQDARIRRSGAPVPPACAFMAVYFAYARRVTPLHHTSARTGSEGKGVAGRSPLPRTPRASCSCSTRQGKSCTLAFTLATRAAARALRAIYLPPARRRVICHAASAALRCALSLLRGKRCTARASLPLPLLSNSAPFFSGDTHCWRLPLFLQTLPASRRVYALASFFYATNTTAFKAAVMLPALGLWRRLPAS